MNRSADHSTADHRAIELDGGLDQAGASAQLAQSNDWFSGAVSLTIDLARVERADSAGVALLLAWQRRAEAKEVSLRLVNVPTSIRSIIEVCGLTSVLPVVDAETAGQ